MDDTTQDDAYLEEEYWNKRGGETYRSLTELESLQGIPYHVRAVYTMLWKDLELLYNDGQVPYLPTISDLENSILKLKEVKKFAHAQTPKWGHNGTVSKAMHESLYLLYEGDALKIVKEMVKKNMHQSKNNS